MGLFTLHNYCVPFLFDYLKSYLEFINRLSIPEFSDYHCLFIKWRVVITVVPLNELSEQKSLIQ